jgi:phospholipid transport system substrate-binding protein
MKKISVYLVSIFFLFQTSSLSYSSNPKEFIQELVTDAIDRLSNTNLNEDEKVIFIEKIALENVDIHALSLYALGELRKSSDEQSLIRYKESFKKYFLKTLTSRLKDYSKSKFEILNIDKKSSNYTIVNSKISPNDGPEIKVDWRVYTKNPDKPLIRDLIIEGLSLARTQKEEFASILNSNNNNINILIDRLEEFVNN